MATLGAVYAVSGGHPIFRDAVNDTEAFHEWRGDNGSGLAYASL